MNHEKWDIAFSDLEIDHVLSFLPLMLDVFALQRYSNRITMLCLRTSHSLSATAKDSHWTKVTNMWPHPQPDTHIMVDEVIQRPDRDASWVKRVLFYQGGRQLWKHKCRTAGKQRSHHSVKLHSNLNKLIRHSCSTGSCCPHATPVNVVFNSCTETRLNTQCSHIAH